MKYQCEFCERDYYKKKNPENRTSYDNMGIHDDFDEWCSNLNSEKTKGEVGVELQCHGDKSKCTINRSSESISTKSPLTRFSKRTRPGPY